MRAPRPSLPEARLPQPPEPSRFGAAELEGLPEPARRHLLQAIALGTPLVTSARLRLDAAGRVTSLVFDRWGDPGNRGAFARHRFGGEFTGYRSFHGLTIPSSGRLGWFYGEDRWPAGEFFRYQITDLEPVTDSAQPGR